MTRFSFPMVLLLLTSVPVASTSCSDSGRTVHSSDADSDGFLDGDGSEAAETDVVVEEGLELAPGETQEPESSGLTPWCTMGPLWRYHSLPPVAGVDCRAACEAWISCIPSWRGMFDSAAYRRPSLRSHCEEDCEIRGAPDWSAFSSCQELHDAARFGPFRFASEVDNDAECAVLDQTGWIQVRCSIACGVTAARCGLPPWAPDMFWYVSGSDEENLGLVQRRCGWACDLVAGSLTANDYDFLFSRSCAEFDGGSTCAQCEGSATCSDPWACFGGPPPGGGQ